jgi:hypothetical protein
MYADRGKTNPQMERDRDHIEATIRAQSAQDQMEIGFQSKTQEMAVRA